ncbi:MAG: hypothetical protein AB7L28_17070 [Kofleriaceae bacterium]
MIARLVVPLVLALLALGTAAVAQPAPAPAPAPAPTPAPAPAPAPQASPAGDDSLRLQGRPIERVQFRGDRTVEDDAIRVLLLA